MGKKTKATAGSVDRAGGQAADAGDRVAPADARPTRAGVVELATSTPGNRSGVSLQAKNQSATVVLVTEAGLQVPCPVRREFFPDRRSPLRPPPLLPGRNPQIAAAHK